MLRRETKDQRPKTRDQETKRPEGFRRRARQNARKKTPYLDITVQCRDRKEGGDLRPACTAETGQKPQSIRSSSSSAFRPVSAVQSQGFETVADRLDPNREWHTAA